MKDVKITFGFIVLNGEPFMRYNLLSIYSFAHQIIVVEGACRAAARVATIDGHSIDGTLETLRSFKETEDPAQKVVIVTAKDEGFDDGFWPEKDEMSRAYARRATGNYLWQIDSDEFYFKEDLEKVRQLLATGVDSISFPTLHFFGGLSYKLEGFYMICDRYAVVHRVFKWGADYQYVTHRPPTVINGAGLDLRTQKWIDGSQASKLGLKMYHYSYLFPHQVFKKASYYSTASESKERGGYIPGADCWAREVYLNLARPFRMFITEKSLCWLERYSGPHPFQVTQMMETVESRRILIETRRTDDLERLLMNRAYSASCFLLRNMAFAMNNRPCLFIRAYTLSAIRYSRQGCFWKQMARVLKRLFGMGLKSGMDHE